MTRVAKAEHGPTAANFLIAKLRGLDAALAETMPRVAANSDAEAIHDMRVAIRRLRTILKLARPIFGRFFADAVRAGFTEVQRTTGALRDEEVLGETLGDLKLADPRFETWRTRRKLREKSLRREVLRRLEAGDLANARTLLNALITLPVKPARDKDLAKFARKCVESARREVEALRDTPTTDIVGLHNLRIAYKHLRYAAEILADALPLDLAAMAKPAAQFQKRLGEIHDVDVAFASIERARGLLPVTRGRALRALVGAREASVAKYAGEMAKKAEPKEASAITPTAASHSGKSRPAAGRRPYAADRSKPGHARSSRPGPHPPRRSRRRSAGRSGAASPSR